MPSIAIKNIVVPAQLTTSAATYYTVTANTKCEIRKLTFCNTTAGAVSVTVYLVNSGGSANDAATVTKTRLLAAGETWSCSDAIGHVLEAGGTIQALASANTSISIRGTGLETVGL